MIKPLFILLTLTFSFAHPSFGDDTDLFQLRKKPNVLVIFDNSNSMDEDFLGKAVGSYALSSKSVVGKKALTEIASTLKEKIRIGLMTYNIPEDTSIIDLHNAVYFASYDPTSYCPEPPPKQLDKCQESMAKWDFNNRSGDLSACVAACRSGNSLFDPEKVDEIIRTFPPGSKERKRYVELLYPKTKKKVNPSDRGNYIYYKAEFPYYASNEGTAYCYSLGYDPSEGGGDAYDCYRTKTGTSDAFEGYSGDSFGRGFVPTDSDVALGFGDFGRRLYWEYVGPTWFSLTPERDGKLILPVDDLVDDDGKPTKAYDKLLKKLDPKNKDSYTECTQSKKNDCDYIVNAGLTPTAGTFGKAYEYFNDDATSPIQAWCQKNFIVYVTDGLPSVSDKGQAASADTLIDGVKDNIEKLKNFKKEIQGVPNEFGIKTYLLGVGLSDEAKQKLDEMAVQAGTDSDGHAYFADQPDDLIDSLQRIFTNIIESSYSFTSPSVPSVRVIDEDILYISSFTPKKESSFWPGNLRGYQLNADGTLLLDATKNPSSSKLVKDFGTALNGQSDRAIYIAVNRVKKTLGEATAGDLDVADTEARSELIAFLAGEKRAWKLGDIFHSNPVIVGAPSTYFEDEGYNGKDGFYEKRKDRPKMIIVGANDGMLHAFNASSGLEAWAFIPDGVRKNLKGLTASSDHGYYVDSTPKVADVSLYAAVPDRKKTAADWRTVVICGLRKGGNTYFALDITNPADTSYPGYLWELPDPANPTHAGLIDRVGQSWSEPAIGKVKYESGGNLYERWVAFFGGGFGEGSDPKGRTFFVVDVMNGDLLWEYSYGTGDAEKAQMNYPLAAPPAAVDTNFDGYVDKVYIGDLGGQMWVFDISFDANTKKSNSRWTGRRLFAPPSADLSDRIYYPAAVALGRDGSPWVYFGTGDRENPLLGSGMFYAVKDDGQPALDKKGKPKDVYVREKEDLKEFSPSGSASFSPATGKGWYIDLAAKEKVLSRPSVFNRLVYFTTYTSVTSKTGCEVQGEARLYVVEYLSGGGAYDIMDMAALTGDAHSSSEVIGSGVPSSPVISLNSAGKGSLIIETTSGEAFSRKVLSRPTNKELLYWREVIR